MPDKPIIFSAPMIRALLDGRKTQTRRVLKPQPFQTADGWGCVDRNGAPQKWLPDLPGLTPYIPGYRLWVKERWRTVSAADDRYTPAELGWQGGACLIYDATDETQTWNGKTRSPIHMPRWASRMTLGVTEVRVQRLQEISEADARAEGAKAGDWPDRPKCSCDDEDCAACSHYPALYKPAFRHLWNTIHGPVAWDANPWVCALTFTVHRCNIDQMER